MPDAGRGDRHRDMLTLLDRKLERERLVGVELDRAFGARGRCCNRRRRPRHCRVRTAPRHWSPVRMKRGSVAVSTTGSRTTTSPVALPTLSLLQATAITRTVPAKAGISNATCATTVAADGDDAGIKRERRLRRRRAGQFTAPISPPVRIFPRRTLHAVDQLPVDVADFGGEPPLAEIIFVGRRRLVVGQVEDADVDGGDDDARLLAGLQPGEHAPAR